MDSSISLKDQIWFLRMCHHVSNVLYLSTLSSLRGLGRSYFHKRSQDISEGTVIRLRDELPRNHVSIQSESKRFSCYPKQTFRPSGALCFLFSNVSILGVPSPGLKKSCREAVNPTTSLHSMVGC